MVISCRLILEIGILRTSKRKGQIRVKKGAKKKQITSRVAEKMGHIST